MKYYNLQAFQKHLSSAAPDNLCRIYLVCMADDFERAKVLDSIVRYCRGAPTRFSGTNIILRDLIDASQNMSFFATESLFLVDEVEKIAKKDLQLLIDNFSLLGGRILFGSRSKTALAPIVEKEGIVLDMLEEKPWDKEKRLLFLLTEQVQKAGKKWAQDAEKILLERIGSDPALLYSEVDKLLCFIGERSTITKEDVMAISPASKSATLWNIAEEVVWDGGNFATCDNTSFHGLIPALRHQLHIGLTLSTLIKENRPSEEWGQYVPKLWPKMLEKRSSQSAHLGVAYFQKGLKALFEIELLSRTHSTHYRALLDLFRGRIHGG